MRPKMEFPNEWTIPDATEDCDTREADRKPGADTGDSDDPHKETPLFADEYIV
jgi:hypothetical protein